jgi:hypothetical protein
MPRPAHLRTTAAATGLLAIAGLHVLWATGSPWPCATEEELADLVVGRVHGPVPPPAACLAVAGALTVAATGVAGRPRARPGVARLLAASTVAVLTVRGAAGLAGRTDVLSPGSSSPRFRWQDRRLYAPLCLALAAGSLPAVRR